MITYVVKRLAAMLTLLVAVLLTGAPASAGSKAATIEFGAYPSTARAANGDTVEISGAGSFTLQPKSVNGEAPRIAAAFGAPPRVFTQRDAAEAVVAEGSWEPIAVLNYRSYGPATAEQDAMFGGLPPGTEGGELRIQVALFVGGEHVGNGIVTIVCLLGEPPKHAEEAMLLLAQGGGGNFNQPVHADTVFIRY